MDAYIRDYGISVPEDCVVAATEDANEQALAYLKRVCRADTTPAEEMDLEALLRAEGNREETAEAGA